MLARVPAFFAASALVALAGCSGGRTQIFTPLNDTLPSSLANASVKETVLHGFVGGVKDGASPIGGLLKVGNFFYGTTCSGGLYDKGTVFSISPNGKQFTVLRSFKVQQDGSCPASGLTNAGGTLYGTTETGGTNGKGTVFSITPAGAFTTLYSFKGGSGDGDGPVAALTNVGGTLYGTTASGGSARNGSSTCSNCGTVFTISTSGRERVLYFFGSKLGDGTGPKSLLVRVGGKLYGTTTNGGIGGVTGNGTIFSLTTGGKETVVYRFTGKSDGDCSFNCYLTNLGGTLYGTARNGGKNRIGSVFSITAGGAFKTLYSASTKSNAGGYPSAGLTNAGGTLYGTMSIGPAGKNGTVFSVTTGGALKAIYAFAGGNNGAQPMSSLTFFGGNLFGTTARGGSKNAGTIFSISGF
jgi:uncharacterized repeat protein (TIGR03803 family)